MSYFSAESDARTTLLGEKKLPYLLNFIKYTWDFIEINFGVLHVTVHADLHTSHRSVLLQYWKFVCIFDLVVG